MNKVMKTPLFVLTTLLVSGCLGGGYDLSVSSSPEFEQLQSKCASLFQNPVFNSIRSKMVVGPDDVPTRKMITLMESPTETEIASVKRLEEANRTCKEMRQAAKIPYSASEDIYESRISKLRYGLYNGDIPYAVYNFGVANALREQARFENEGAVAFQKGREIGNQRAAAAIQQMSNQMQMDAIQSKLNSFNNSGPLSGGGTNYWNCTASPVGINSVSVNCY